MTALYYVIQTQDLAKSLNYFSLSWYSFNYHNFHIQAISERFQNGKLKGKYSNHSLKFHKLLHIMLKDFYNPYCGGRGSQVTITHLALNDFLSHLDHPVLGHPQYIYLEKYDKTDIKNI